MPSATPIITFLISTYNRRAVLLRTLDELQKIAALSGVAAETIVVDNASTDGAGDAVAAEFPDVRLIRGERNRGACAKNAGLAVAAGQFIIFLDDDSYPTADSLGRMIEHFTGDPQLGAAVFDVVLPDRGHECSAYPNVFIGCGTGFRREALRQVGGLPEDYFMQAEEYDLSLRLLEGGWAVRRCDDLLVHHLKTPGARSPTRTTRLDVRNNLTLIARRFPRRWALPFAIDWMRRYRWIARSKGWRHELAFWRGLVEGLARAIDVRHRKPVSPGAFEKFARVDEIRRGFECLVREQSLRSVVLLDVGKNILPYWLAARSCGVRIAAIADERLAAPGRCYRGIRVIDNATAGAMEFDVAVIANVSPVHAALREKGWRNIDSRPVVDLLSSIKLGASESLAPGRGDDEITSVLRRI